MIPKYQQKIKVMKVCELVSTPASAFSCRPRLFLMILDCLNKVITCHGIIKKFLFVSVSAI